MKDQLNKIMEAESMTPAKFADEIGVQRSSISHIISGRNKPSYDFIIKLLNRFKGINAEWLLTGEGSMIKSNKSGQSTEKENESLFENRDENDKILLLNRKEEGTVKNKNTIKENGELKDQDITESSADRLKEKFEFTNVNKIKYLVTFYDDGSFEQYFPRD
jgi:plasmid maintenance system antidote protein VapI